MSAPVHQYKGFEEKLTLYEKAVRLRARGLTYPEIGGVLGIGKDTIGAWIRGNPPKRVRRYEPDLSPSPELAYLIGFYYGDGRSAGREPKVRFKLADRGQLEYVGKLVARILGRKPKPISLDGQFFVVDYDSVALSRYLQSPPRLLMDCIGSYKRNFLRGFFDAEGYATWHVDTLGRRVGGFCAGAANTQKGYLHLAMMLLRELGIRSSIRRTNKAGGEMIIRGKTWIRKHDVYHIVVSGQPNLEKFHELVGFQGKLKARKLSDIVALIKMPPDMRYNWFGARYRKEGRRWVRIDY